MTSITRLSLAFTCLWCSGARNAEVKEAHFATVGEAWETVSKLDDVVRREEKGFLVIADRANATVWMFSKAEQAAHPALIERRVIERDGKLLVESHLLCEGKSAACDELASEMRVQNERAGNSMRKQSKPQ